MGEGHPRNISDFPWDAAAASVKGNRRSGQRGEGEGRDVPPFSLSRDVQFAVDTQYVHT